DRTQLAQAGAVSVLVPGVGRGQQQHPCQATGPGGNVTSVDVPTGRRGTWWMPGAAPSRARPPAAASGSRTGRGRCDVVVDRDVVPEVVTVDLIDGDRHAHLAVVGCGDDAVHGGALRAGQATAAGATPTCSSRCSLDVPFDGLL